MRLLKLWRKLSKEERRGEGEEYFIQTLFPNHTLHSKFLRLIKEQQRQVWKVLQDGLYDPDSPISKLLGVHTEVMGEIIWQKLVENWQIFPGQ